MSYRLKDKRYEKRKIIDEEYNTQNAIGDTRDDRQITSYELKIKGYKNIHSSLITYHL